VNSYSLDDFGKYETLADAEATFEHAIAQILNKGGGQLSIPQSTHESFTPRNLQQQNNPLYGIALGEDLNLNRQPTVGVTIVDQRNGFERTYLPPAGCPESETLFGNASSILERTLSQNLPHQGSFMSRGIFSRYLGGGSSYALALNKKLEEEKQLGDGHKDKFYVHTHRGLFIGQELALNGIAAKVKVSETGEELYGNPQQNLAYFVANTPHTIRKESSVYVEGIQDALTKILVDVAAGNGQKFYISESDKGKILPGQSLIIRTGVYIKIRHLGIDRHGRYFIPETNPNLIQGESIYSKNIVGGLIITDTANCDNQSPSLKIVRSSYGAGDTFGTWNELNYQSNIMSAGGDEGGVGNASELKQDLDCFWGVVEKWDENKRELIYREKSPVPQNPHKLGTSRPLINMSKRGWIHQGKVLVVAPGVNYLRSGKLQNEIETTKTGDKISRISTSLVVGNSDANWDESIVGKFFAVNEETEYYENGDDYYHAEGGKIKSYSQAAGEKIRVYRWWHITDFEIRKDNKFNLYIEQVVWDNTLFVKGGPSLFLAENYTYSADRTRELSYIIAPGAWVTDVRKGVAIPSAGRVGLPSPIEEERVLKLAPTYNHTEPEVEAARKPLFEAGDLITNAPGAEPWNPTGFRSRHFSGFPTQKETASFISKNLGAVQMSAGLIVSDAHPGKSLDVVLEKQKDRKPSFKTGVDITASTKIGLLIHDRFSRAGIDITNNPASTYSDADNISGDLSKAGVRVSAKTDAALDLLSALPDRTQLVRWKWWHGFSQFSLTRVDNFTDIPSQGNWSIIISKGNNDYFATIFGGNEKVKTADRERVKLSEATAKKISNFSNFSSLDREEKYKLIENIASDTGFLIPSGNPFHASLSIRPWTGDFIFSSGFPDGGNIDLNGKGSINHKGISKTAVPASNLRGINITPQQDSIPGYFFVSFNTLEIDEYYSIQAETSWLTQKAITKKTIEGFQVKFDVPPPENGTIDWLLIR